MKKQKIFGILMATVAIVAVVAVALGMSYLFESAGMIIATGVAATSVERMDIDTNSDISRFNTEDISRAVVEMLPARTPLDTIMRNHMRKAEKIDSLLKTFYAVSAKPLYDVLADAGTGAADGTSDAAAGIEYTYASGNGLATFWLQPANLSLWNVDDTFLMRDVVVKSAGTVGVINGSSETKMDIAFYVIQKGDNGIKVQPLNGILGLNTLASTYVMPDFADDITIYRMGNAKNELAAQTTPFALLPEPQTNYAQYFMAQVEESLFQRNSATEANWNFTDFERQNIYAMRAEMEMSFLYGAKALVTNAYTSDKRYTTGGITRYIENQLTYGTGGADRTVSNTQYKNIMKQVFTGNNGSKERILLAGSTLMASLESLETVSKQLGAKNTEVKWGLEFNKIVNNFGTLLVYHHPLMSLLGAADHGIILDMEHIRKHEFQPMKVVELDLIKSGQRNSNARVISECSLVTTAFPDCHAVLKPTA